MLTNEKATAAVLLTTAELARKYQVSARTILNWEQQGRITPAVRVKRVLRWREDEVEAALERETSNPESE